MGGFRQRFALLLGVLLAFAPVLAAATDDVLVFSFFRKNGEDGLYLAASEDGLNWKALNGDRPLLKPEVGESRLMRDPSITRGPDGTFHMVWTTAWQGKTIGYASSRDLVNWSGQRAFTPLPQEANVMNCWAPEVFFDEKSREFVVVWASTISGRFPETQGTGTQKNNHRLYAFRTRDFKTIGAAKLLYDPGFIVIDAAIFRPDQRYAMVVKNETTNPPAKYLFLSFADSPDGPWSAPGPRITGNEWVEGPSPIRIGDAWYIYFDKYRARRYGVIRSTDLTNWEDLSDRLAVPDGARHGTVFRAPRAIISPLR
jgi:sucrose-6-phosphate hydrolase SacC (GH32 family)